jgi:hypothetical protein
VAPKASAGYMPCGALAVYWFVGGTDAAAFAAAGNAGTIDSLPSNHAPDFAPVIDPTLHTGIETLVTTAGVWLRAGDAGQ